MRPSLFGPTRARLSPRARAAARQAGPRRQPSRTPTPARPSPNRSRCQAGPRCHHPPRSPLLSPTIGQRWEQDLHAIRLGHTIPPPTDRTCSRTLARPTKSDRSHARGVTLPPLARARPITAVAPSCVSLAATHPLRTLAARRSPLAGDNDSRSTLGHLITPSHDRHPIHSAIGELWSLGL